MIEVAHTAEPVRPAYPVEDGGLPGLREKARGSVREAGEGGRNFGSLLLSMLLKGLQAAGFLKQSFAAESEWQSNGWGLCVCVCVCVSVRLRLRDRESSPKQQSIQHLRTGQLMTPNCKIMFVQTTSGLEAIVYNQFQTTVCKLWFLGKLWSA